MKNTFYFYFLASSIFEVLVKRGLKNLQIANWTDATKTKLDGIYFLQIWHFRRKSYEKERANKFFS